MANDYFKFKQFTVQQNNCAMKVTTDACLFGAWSCNILKNFQAETILDIGAGTGLLSLMLAQTTNASIVGVEIEEKAAIQATENVNNSPWKDRISIHHQPIQEYLTDKKFDVIISNPPFFKNSLLSDDEKRNTALHSNNLTFFNLKSIVDNLLINNGLFLILLQHERHNEIIEIMKDYYLMFITSVKPTPQHQFFRAMLCFSNNKYFKLTENQLIIKDNDDKYSNEFSILLSEFYLNL